MKLSRLVVGENRISWSRTAAAMRWGRLFAAGRVRITGGRNTTFAFPESRLLVGLSFFGISDARDRTLIRIRGHLSIDGRVEIARGARWDIGPNAHVRIGKNTYFSPFGIVVATGHMAVGDDCAIGWNVQVLDSDFHSIQYDRAPATAGFQPDKTISIGNHVWIGSHAKLYKGASIADGCVVAGSSVVTKRFEEPNCLIAGTPARVIRSGISWN
jgi:acetyltransferase-like isoleucine patch superfamily enzyme